MNVLLKLSVDDPDDVDSGHEMGITSDAYDRLMESLTDAGFSVVDGPHKASA